MWMQNILLLPKKFKRNKLFTKRKRRKTTNKKRMIMSSALISKFVFVKDSFKKKDVPQKNF
jgi:hypothetical protein